jgi:hypothetical protein
MMNIKNGVPGKCSVTDQAGNKFVGFVSTKPATGEAFVYAECVVPDGIRHPTFNDFKGEQLIAIVYDPVAIELHEPPKRAS